MREEKIEIVPSRENFLERFLEKYSNRIERCYTEEWNRYVDVVRDFLDMKITQKLNILLVDTLEPIPNTITREFTREQKIAYCDWMFTSSTLCLMDKDVKVGDRVSHNLPTSFKIYLNKRKREVLQSGGLPKQANIKEYEQIVNTCVKVINNELKGRDFEVRRSDTAVETDYGYFTVNLVQFRRYNRSEDILLRGKKVTELKNYKPNDFFLNEKSLINSAMTAEGILAVTATVGLLTLTSIVTGGAIGKYKIDKSVKEYKEATKYFTSAEVTMFEHFCDLLSKDLDALEDDYISTVATEKLIRRFDIGMSDNFRGRTNSERYRIDPQIGSDNEKLVLKLVFYGALDRYSDGLVDSELLSDYDKLAKRVKTYVNTELKKIPFKHAKIKDFDIINPGRDDIDPTGSIELVREIHITLPKEVKRIVNDIKERMGESGKK